MDWKKITLLCFLVCFSSTKLPAPVVAEVVVDLVVVATEAAEETATAVTSAIITSARVAKAITSRESNTGRITAHLNKATQFTNQNSASTVADADFVASKIKNLGGRKLLEASVKLMPIAYSAHIQANLFNDTYLAQIFDLSPRGYIYFEPIKKRNESSQPAARNSTCEYTLSKGLFFAPVLIYNDYHSTQGDFLVRGQPGFTSYSYGIAGGWRQLFTDHLCLTGGIGYSHTNLHWRKDLGNSRWSSIYVAPTLSWFSHRTFLNFQVMGSFNFFNTDRKYLIPGIERHAKSKYPIYDLLLHANGGYIFSFKKNFGLQLEGTLNYLTLFMSSYEESGAGSLNLAVKSRQRYILQPRFLLRLIKSFCSKKFYYAPNLYVGWLDSIPLTEDIITAKHKEVVPDLYFRTRGYRDPKNQLLIGAEFLARRGEKFQIKGNFEWNLLSRISVFSTYVKMAGLF